MPATKKDLKDKAIYGRQLADLLFLKAMNNSSPEVQKMILAATHLDAMCNEVLPDDDCMPVPSFENLAVKVEAVEQLLIGSPQE